jgi:hypothetical protein
MADITSPTIIWAKGLLFLLIGLFASILLALLAANLRVVLLHVLAVWGFCRFYYFAFYVIEQHVDSKYRFSGLLSFLRYAIRQKRAEPTRPDVP